MYYLIQKVMIFTISFVIIILITVNSIMVEAVQPSMDYAPQNTMAEMLAQMSGGLDYVCWADQNGDTYGVYPVYYDSTTNQIKLSGNKFYVYYYLRTAPANPNSQRRYYQGSLNNSQNWFLEPNGATIRTSLPVLGGLPATYIHGNNTVSPLLVIAIIISICLSLINLFRRRN